MNLNKYLVICALFLIGCEGSFQPTIHPGVTDTVTGISIEYNSGFIYPLEKIVATYIKVEECMGMAAYPGPNIIIYDDVRQFLPDIQSFSGVTYFDPPLIILIDEGLKNDNVLLLRHEMVHYILRMNGMPNQDNENHLSYLFNHCGDHTYLLLGK